MTDTSLQPRSTSVETQRPDLYALLGKRVLDLVLTVLLAPLFLLALAPILAIVAFDRGPLFFSHSRVGIGGKTIRVLKIRSMVPDAEARLKTYLAGNPEAAQEWDESRKLKNDPRITRIGRILRATSLDELPQIWNVLRGDMSWVGPRPIVTDELEKYGAAARVYLSLKPGITGLWQVSGRNSESYEDRVAMDIRYSRIMSPFLDLQIVLKTVLVVLRKTGI